MDDIIEKLSLLDYENSFCKGWKHKRISRVYFANPPTHDEDEVSRIHMLYDMTYWLMSLNKDMVSSDDYVYKFQISIKYQLNHILILLVFRAKNKGCLSTSEISRAKLTMRCKRW